MQTESCTVETIFDFKDLVFNLLLIPIKQQTRKSLAEDCTVKLAPDGMLAF